jgi:flagellar M-ring protein FliF
MENAEASAPRRQQRLFIIVLAALLLALGVGYFMFVRQDYVLLYSDLRPPEAASLVTELDRRGVSYRLGQGGSSILVPAGDADRLRVGLAGTELPTKGDVGFELFNESSMGLTDFAQKINYQRALQGELSRTIMAMEGIETARVHLALPERALFRGSRSEPRAAVTVIPRGGRVLDEARVLGIQRLVASAVPELPLANVIVLDAFGRTVSPAPTIDAAAAVPAELAAAQDQYRAAIRQAITQAVPDLSFELELALTPSAPADLPSADPLTNRGPRPFNLAIAVTSAAPVGTDSQARIAAALRSSVAFDESHGDSLLFRTAVATAPAQPGVLTAPAPALLPAEVEHLAAGGALERFLAANWASLLALLGIAAVLIVGRRRSAAGARAERDEFVRRIRAHLGDGSAAHGG